MSSCSIAGAQGNLESKLGVSCWLDESVSESSGRLRWKINLTMRNDSGEELFFGDDMVLMEGQGERSYDGVYVAYHAKVPEKSPGNWDFYGRATAFGIANFERNWPDGTSRGYRNGGTYSFADPPDYKPKKTFCNTSLLPGKSVPYESVLEQGTWTNPEMRDSVLLLLPEVKNSSASLRFRSVLTFKRSYKAKNRWDLKKISAVALEKAKLEALLASPKKDVAMRIIALNCLAAADKDAVAKFLLADIKDNSESLELVSAIQLLGLYDITPDAEALSVINDLASDAKAGAWSHFAAMHYVKSQSGE